METPQIILKEWATSFESCVLDEKLGNRLKFWAKFYFQGKFIFMEKLEESKREYKNSGNVLILRFGKRGHGYESAEFHYDLRTQVFYISINGQFTIEFSDLASKEDSTDVLKAHNDNIWCNYDFMRNLRYHIACKTIPIEDKLRHTFDSFELGFVIQ